MSRCPWLAHAGYCISQPEAVPRCQLYRMVWSMAPAFACGSQIDGTLCVAIPPASRIVNLATTEHRPTATTLQVPPSGPMDALSLQYANALCGNTSCTAALEITLRGPRLQFHRAATIAVCGGEAEVTVASGGRTTAVPMWANFKVAAGDVVSVGVIAQGARSYFAVDGGFDAPLYLGSRSTFPSGNLGGYQGRALQVLSVASEQFHAVTEITCAH